MRWINVAGAARVAKRAALALALIVIGYVACGLVGGLIPTNRGWRPPADGITIFVEDNGIHTGLVLPVIAAGVDWRSRTPAADVRDPRYAGHDHIAFGWGERAFYLDTPTWADVRPRIVLAAALGSDRTLLHVEHVPRPAPANDVRAIVLRPAEYHALAHFIAASFAVDGGHLPGYADDDAFYEARGRYDWLHTCNAWTGDALRSAGVRIGAWTPFPFTVMQWF